MPLPSLPEQRRIVARIEELTRKIAEARGLATSASHSSSEIVSAVVDQLFPNEPPSTWSGSRLADWVIRCQYGTSEKADDDSLGTPVLRMGNIQNGRLDINSLKYLILAPDVLQRLQLNKGDILVNRTNSAELVGKCAVFDLMGEYVFASYIIRLQVDETRANPWLLAHYINSSRARSFLFANKKQMTGQANINSRTLLNLPVALPNLDEQQALLGLIERTQQRVDEIQLVQNLRSAELDALLPSILDKVFRGEL
jgi:type I restriction enzyme S subunit